MADGDADQETGATAEATDAGESGEGDTDADAGQDNSGATEGVSEEKLQKVYNRGAKEAREALEGKLDEYREEIESLRSELDGGSSNGASGEGGETDQDLYTEEQLEEIKSSYQSKKQEIEEEAEQLRDTLRETNREHARNRLIEALREQDVIKPETFADTFIAQGRVEADLSEGRDAIEVFTSDGNRMLNGDGDHASIEDLAASWADENPEFVRSSTREGAGYGGSEGGGTVAANNVQEMSEQEKMDFIDEHGQEEWNEIVRKSYQNTG